MTRQGERQPVGDVVVNPLGREFLASA